VPTIDAQFREGTLLVTRSETVDSITTTNVYTIAPDGTTEQLTDVPRGTYASRPYKAANAPLVAYYSNKDGQEDIYVLNLKTNATQRVTNDATSDFNPSLSPDGSLISWVSRREDPSGDILLANADGTHARAIAPSPDSDRSPFFSPDGTQVSFHSYRTGGANIFVVDVDGQNLQQITNGDHLFFAYNAVWSPDGQQFVYLSEQDDDGTVDIYTISRNGSNAQLLLPNVGHSVVFWSPDGEQIVFNSDRPERGAKYRQIYTASVAMPSVSARVAPFSQSEDDYYSVSWWYGEEEAKPTPTDE
jgi:Tol biopolymer transport system component